MSWEERAARGRELAGVAELSPEALMPLLLDPEDTAVTLATAEALLAREDAPGLELVLRALARADDDTGQWLHDAFLTHAATRRSWAIRPRVEAYADHPDPELAEAARQFRWPSA